MCYERGGCTLIIYDIISHLQDNVVCHSGDGDADEGMMDSEMDETASAKLRLKVRRGKNSLSSDSRYEEDMIRIRLIR